ncbi:putative erythrocyte-binding protein [Neospora caninum Liverpool]|uniref:Erythrocyte-binding protein, putative n=1 Tax=Neospora caninum (strain Liverpool) TaxID=572307 RepID=F0VP16_NEOCL|nr:putative erythrocyte-binding protein [Neospora caninum Liverpool]CBZ55462.1 putative erythrocyte-binding protein [Neospora caninum Liverpool]CEL70199.1 TPA: erythrocyte-binding protein, putative [Neospora caninum Liverpool]|eukprot:XP_003885490.1 putative erythrocyte-binding protein [Neospora caninum Liverpool]
MAARTPNSVAPVRVKREEGEELQKEGTNGVSSPRSGAPRGQPAAPAEGPSEHQASRRHRIRELAVHFSGAFDQLLSLVPFSAVSNVDEGDQETEDQVGDTGPGGAPAQSRGQQKWKLRQKRYHPRVLVATPLRLQEQVAGEEDRARKRQGAGRSSKQQQAPKQRGLPQTPLGTSKPESGDASSGIADSRAELQRRLQVKLEALRRVKKEDKRERGKRKKPSKERPGQKSRASEGQTREEGRGVHGDASPKKRPPQGDSGNFEYGAVTCPRERFEVRQANRAGTKKRKLQQAMREIESNREILQKCQSSEERQRVELQQSMAKVMKKLDGEKVMDDMQRLKKKQKFLEKKKEKAADKWQSRLMEAKEKKRMALEAKKQQKEERLREREKRKS